MAPGLGVGVRIPVSRFAILFCLSGALMAAWDLACAEEPAPANNSLCLVCHLDLASETIAELHRASGVGCTDCHGPTTDHMHDEMLMTKPDLLFGRREVEPFCRDCHEEHADPDAVETFRTEWLGKSRENGRTITANAICTDCHGTHNIVKKMGAPVPTEDSMEPEWVSLFNGEDLAGWKPAGNAAWRVERGSIVGRQGPDNAAGDLLTEREFDDFELLVTFKMRWPGNSGVWFRYQSPEKAFQADILEHTNPVCYTGSLYCPGKRFLALNEDPETVARDLWNTLTIRTEGDHLTIMLNDTVVADVRDKSTHRGRVGFQVHAGEAFKDMQITVREVLIRPLPAETIGGLFYVSNIEWKSTVRGKI
jgi:3-keto-disaccharide hydrolase/cytochrome c3-like protein